MTGKTAPWSYDEEIASHSSGNPLLAAPMNGSKDVPAEASGAAPELWGGSLSDEGLQQGLAPAASRRWLHVDHSGNASLVEVDKHRVVAELGVRYRDLLAVDPTVPIPFPASILIRERALVVNLETVRMIICANQCYILSVPKVSDPRLATFPSLDHPFVKQLSKVLRTGKSTIMLPDFSRAQAAFDYDSPYELRALEVALATVTNVVDREVFDLEKEAYPTIDRLANNVSKEVLEAVRSVKQAMTKLIGRVQRLKSELEDILEDDADMQDMYLARRAAMLGEELPPDPLCATVGQTMPHLHPSPTSSMASLSTASAADGGAPWETVAGSHQPDGGASSPAAEAAGFAGAHRSATDLAASGGSQHGGRHHGSGRHGGGRHGGERHSHGGHGSHGSIEIRKHGTDRGGHGRAQQLLQRPSMVVRTVRRPRKGKEKGSGAAVPAAAQEGLAATEEGGGEERLVGGVAEGAEETGPAPAATRAEAAGGDTGSEAGDSDDGEVIETYIEQPAMPAVDPHEVEEAEDMLEAFYIQVDGILRRLLLVSERIDDTEDLVAIQMDHRRNELVATDLLVTTATAGFAWAAMIAGIFGMNLWNTVWQEDHGVFVGVMLVALCGGAAIVVAIVAWIRHRRLMFIPNM